MEFLGQGRRRCRERLGKAEIYIVFVILIVVQHAQQR